MRMVYQCVYHLTPSCLTDPRRDRGAPRLHILHVRWTVTAVNAMSTECALCTQPKQATRRWGASSIQITSSCRWARTKRCNLDAMSVSMCLKCDYFMSPTAHGVGHVLFDGNIVAQKTVPFVSSGVLLRILDPPRKATRRWHVSSTWNIFGYRWAVTKRCNLDAMYVSMCLKRG